MVSTAIVRHWQNGRRNAEPPRSRRGKFGERHSAAQRAGALDMHGQIAVAEPEPGLATHAHPAPP